MGKFPKKIKIPSWINMDEYQWSAHYRVIHGNRNKNIWENERRLYNVLKKSHKVFHHVYFVNDDNTVIPYEYDFYLPDDNIVVEYNGREHYDPWAVFHDDIFSFLRKVSSDMEKIKIAYERGLRYVPISYDDVISKSTVERALKHYKSIEDVLSHYIRRYADCLKIPEKDLQIL